jgi:phosphoribosylformylglycinamidine synthase
MRPLRLGFILPVLEEGAAVSQATTQATTPNGQRFHAKIYVTLRPSVLDPAGTAVQSGLQHLGYDNVEQVRIGKYVELQVTAADEAAARAQLDRICDQLLANPVIENYRFELT